eukprot:2837977-Pleurochrysis_carterae.AAC.2
MLGPFGVIPLGLVLSAQWKHRLAENHLRGGNKLALVLSVQHLKTVAGFKWQGAKVDALVCAWLQLAFLQCIMAARIRQAEHRAEVA